MLDRIDYRNDLIRPRIAPGALTPAWYEMVPHPVRRCLVDTMLQTITGAPGHKRFVGIKAGRQSGKTETMRRSLILALRISKPWKDARYFYTADTVTKAYGLAFEQCLALIPPAWLDGKPLRSKSWMEIRTVFGTSLRFGGLQGCEWIEGLPWDGGVADEACDCPERAWERSIKPALSVRQGWGVRMGAMKRGGVGTSAFKRWLKEIESGEFPDCVAFKWTSGSVMDIIDPEIVQVMARNMSARDFNEQMNAEDVEDGGLWMWAWCRDVNMRPCNHDPSLPIIVGQDFNADPMHWLLGHRKGDNLEWFDELFLHDTNTPRTLDVLWQRYGLQNRAGWIFCPDAASKQRKTSAERSDYAWILADERFQHSPGGRRIIVPSGNPRRNDRFASCNAMWKSGDGRVRMFVDPRCKHVIESIETQLLGQEDEHIGHGNDAIGYAVWSLFGLAMERQIQSSVVAHAQPPGGVFAKAGAFGARRENRNGGVR